MMRPEDVRDDHFTTLMVTSITIPSPLILSVANANCID